MDLLSKCGKCQHFLWEHDSGGDARCCRYDNCVLYPDKLVYQQAPRHPGMFTPKPETCRPCPLFGSGLGFARAYGEGKKGIFILAESLGEEEERQSRPLVGKTGQQTLRMIARTVDPETQETLHLDRDFVRGNVVCCKPPFNRLDSREGYEAIGHCRQYWTEDVAKAAPKAILAMGDVASRAIAGVGGITQLRGSVFETDFGPVVVTLHPAYLLRGKLALSTYWRMDLLRALQVSRHGAPKRPVYYTLYPTGADMQAFYEEWVEAGRPPMAVDIETPHSSAMKDEDPLGGGDEEGIDVPIEEDPSYTILRWSLSWKKGFGLTAPHISPFREWLIKILAEAPITEGWNSENFDLPRLENDGVEIGGDHIDLMLLFHLLSPELPQGLKQTANTFIPGLPPAWVSKKLAKDEPVLYSAIDADATITVGEILIERAKREGKWPVFQRQFVQLGRVLRKMTRRGILTDGAIRQKGREDFAKRLEKVIREIQPLVPQEVLKKKVFKKSEEWLRKSGNWVEGRMVEVTSMEKPPKPKKLDFRVFYPKQLKKGPCEKSKLVKAFTKEEALSKVEGALRAEEVGTGSVGEGNSAEGAA